MRIDDAALEGNRLILTTKDRMARRFVYSFKPGDYDIQRSKKQRSLDANAYAWVLIDKLAEATGYPKEQVYRDAVRNVGGNTDTFCGEPEAVAKLCSIWRGRGLGWQTEMFPSKIPGTVGVVLYYGSSTFNSRQMAHLIDNLVEDCRALDIETMPPDKLTAMLEAYK